MVMIGQNPEKNLGDLRFTVTQTPVKDDQLTPVGKTLEEQKQIIIIIIIIIIITSGITQLHTSSQ